MSYSENQYLKLLSDVYKYGQDTGDRTGTGMRSLFGEKMEFDLREGFPLLTTKKMFTRGVFGELLWFLSGSTSSAELEEKYNVKFWREWQDSKGQLPNIYGKQWVRWNQGQRIIRLERKTKTPTVLECKLYAELEVDYSKGCDRSKLLGKVFPSRKHGDFKVISFKNNYTKGSKRGYVYTIQFLITGFIKNNVTTISIKKGKLEDPYFPSIRGTGFLGKHHDDSSDDTANLLKNVWRKMFERCYDEKHPAFNNYGGRGIFVDSRWHNFENFYEDVQKLPNWNLKKESWDNYNLDKDYYGGNCYSKETCVWLSKKDNTLYGTSEPFILTKENGDEKLFLSKSECGEYLCVDVRRISDILNNKKPLKKYKNIKLNYLNYDKEKYVYRYALPFNQIQYIIDEIKQNPTSRRILFTGWNAPEMQWDDTALPCCHSTVVQFYVEDGHLNLYHHQRSGDMFLGVPVNIASYATLLMMIAQQTGLKAGKMIHSIGVAHIYHNHFEQVEEQLSRQPLQLPLLHIKRKPDSIFDYNLDDFEVLDYKHHDLIKGDVAI